MTGLYLRFQGTTYASRVYGPKLAESPTLNHPCVACGAGIVAGDLTVLVPLGPGDDEEAQQKARGGRYYNAVCVEVHAACAGVSDADREKLPT